MNHRFLTLNQNNSKTPVNAAKRGTLVSDFCFISHKFTQTQTTLQPTPPPQKRGMTSEVSVSTQRQSDEEVLFNQSTQG